jgi:hypothetical protein
LSVGVAVACQAGIVLVTDGRRTAQLAGDPPRYEVASDDAQKLFICDSRFAIATYGEADVGAQGVGQVIDGFDGPVDANCEQYANALGTHVSELLREVATPVRGDLVRADSLRYGISFIVAAQDEDCGRAFEVKVRPGAFIIEPRLETINPAVYPFGLTDGIDRFLNGIDLKGLKKARLQIPEQRQGDLDLLRYDLIYPDTLDEALEFALGLIDIQLFAQRFSHGSYVNSDARIKGCGGRIQAVTMSPSAIEWHQEAA